MNDRPSTGKGSVKVLSQHLAFVELQESQKTGDPLQLGRLLVVWHTVDEIGLQA